MNGSQRFFRLGMLFPLFLLVLTAIYTAAAFDIRTQFTGDGEIGPRTIPLLVAICMYMTLLVVIFQELRRPTEEDAGTGLSRPLLVVGATAAYILLFRPIGYSLSTLLFVLALFRIFEFKPRQPVQFILYAIAVTAVFYGLFAGIFGVRLPALIGGVI
ncbi:tripartite tricarboxylate transporter TctB family protein [Paracoccus saliphilus]|uniref:Tricarboxylic transport membrane protein n=1 Tax=Paracoccus saliphilus TaxID=405559 RepID=A0AA45W0U7_9RHOB|nr:tripartite tricarboxylate transporter TctB family protein [Paracoccus saliphilus]WCR03338.1 tripartite tricarboxylate transporter TctB family protein [Paracoccus saliphilus]SIS51752.1 putative tricarboxylic transport membrane protein [Paracoccus saliphilus]